jgi:hypothetical protein
MRNTLLLWVGAILLAGCGGADEAADSAADGGSPEASAEREETVFDPMVGTMDRARGIEDLGMSRKDEMDAALEQAD